MLHLPKSGRYSAPRNAPRIPPIAIAGFCVSFCLATVIYFHLISEYRALEDRYHELQEKFHLFGDKKETLQRQYNELKAISEESTKKLETALEKQRTCETEKTVLEDTLRKKQSELDSCLASTKKTAI